MESRDAKRFSESALGGIGIQAQHTAALGYQQLCCEQANQAEAANHKGFAEGGVGQANTLQTDRGQHRE
jgi:hypothetical protein